MSKKAAERHTTVDELISPLPQQLAEPVSSSSQRNQAFDDWMSLVKKRSARLHSDHTLDDSRESIYDGRGE